MGLGYTWNQPISRLLSGQSVGHFTDNLSVQKTYLQMSLASQGSSVPILFGLWAGR